MADAQTTIPPPPDPTDSQLQSTTGDKIGGFLGAISRPGSVLGTISSAFQQAHEKRLGKAKMYHDVMIEKLARANSPDATEDEKAQARAAYDAAKAEYFKLAPDPETKKNMQMRTAVAEHHVGGGQNGAGGPQGGAGASQQPAGMSPPPTPRVDFSGPAGAPAGPSGAIPPPPKPDMTDVMAGIPGEMQRGADARTIRMEQEKQRIITQGKIEEEKAKPPTGKTPTPAADAYFSLLDTINPDTGVNYTPDEALKRVTEAQTKKGRPTPFQEYMSDPDHYADFLKETNDAKAAAKGKSPSASIGAVYGIYRMMEMGYKQNPEILPIVAQLAPEVFARAGMKIPPAMASALGKIPVDQPLSPTTGQPIGTSMPSAPTAPTRTAAQTAARVPPIISDLRDQVASLKQYLGPEQGRINVKYLLGKAGSTGDPAKDRALSGLRTNLELLIALSAKFHISSVRAMQEFAKLADAGKDSAPALLGFIDQVEKRAKETQEQEKGFGEIPPPPSPKDNDPANIR